MLPSLARAVSPSGCMNVAGSWVAGLFAEGGDGDHGPRGRITGGERVSMAFSWRILELRLPAMAALASGVHVRPGLLPGRTGGARRVCQTGSSAGDLPTARSRGRGAAEVLAAANLGAGAGDLHRVGGAATPGGLGRDGLRQEHRGHGSCSSSARFRPLLEGSGEARVRWESCLLSVESQAEVFFLQIRHRKKRPLSAQ